jgi:divalent metal cation (Fe/Co/Zn/Cd) transporter
VLVRRALRLEWLTIGWNSLEAVIAAVAGVLSGSIALLGFGLDSVIEVSSGVALVWRLSQDGDAGRRERLEEVTLKIVGVSFLALAAYVAYESIGSLWRRDLPEASYAGIALAALSLVVMPVLARAKRRIAGAIGSRALEADSRQTDLCAYLSAILLGGLILNAVWGIWWADPAAALLMTPIIANEGLKAFSGRTCCTC